MITVYRIENKWEWDADLFRRFLNELPLREQNKYSNLVRWQDRQAGILGKLLLRKGVQELGFDALLQNLRHGTFQKPYFEKGPKFNISHSGHYVVCAISATEEIGIDIEERMMDIRLSDFQSYLTPSEWGEMYQAQNRIHWFYDFWTKKEAVLKASGRGMNIPLDEILLKDDRAWVEDASWQLYTLPFHDFYSCHLASSYPSSLSHVFLTLDDLTATF